jgi:hypothetical protein
MFLKYGTTESMFFPDSRAASRPLIGGMTMTETPRTGRSAKMIAVAVVVGLMGSGALVWQASSAAFTASTENAGNTWNSGSVLLSDSDSGSAMFTASGLLPLATGTNCIEVEYDGTVASTVKLYANLPTGALGQYLDFDVELGSGSTCATPGTYTQIFGDAPTTLDGSDTLTDFTTAHSNFGNGIAGWAPSAANTTRPYRFTWTLGNDNNAQNKSAGVRFVWEAQNN